MEPPVAAPVASTTTLKVKAWPGFKVGPPVSRLPPTPPTGLATVRETARPLLASVRRKFLYPRVTERPLDDDVSVTVNSGTATSSALSTVMVKLPMIVDAVLAV